MSSFRRKPESKRKITGKVRNVLLTMLFRLDYSYGIKMPADNATGFVPASLT